MEAKCIAYTEDGYLCRRPATHIDIQRGGMVCELHVPQKEDPSPDEEARASDTTAED